MSPELKQKHLRDMIAAIKVGEAAGIDVSDLSIACTLFADLEIYQGEDGGWYCVDTNMDASFDTLAGPYDTALEAFRGAESRQSSRIYDTRREDVRDLIKLLKHIIERPYWLGNNSTRYVIEKAFEKGLYGFVVEGLKLHDRRRWASMTPAVEMAAELETRITKDALEPSDIRPGALLQI